ncbi:MAG: hypothetical protein WC220_10445 [Pedobacter sp.]|jgi:hypothetical protein
MLKQVLTAFIVLSCLQVIAQYPEARISNGQIEARLYLPDPKAGFYRGSRFDWSGVIASLKFKDHEYFGEWYAVHDPKRHDAITGPVEAFDPINYDQAAPGETFIKIGVGTVKKINNSPYRFNSPFELVNTGEWKVRTKRDRIIFTHLLNDDKGYSYIYTKTVRLIKGKPELLLEHKLKNTGRKAINTSVFNHNFFMLDKQTTGSDFTVTLPFKIENEPTGKKLMDFSENKMTYLRDLKKGESTMEYPKGYTGNKVEDYDFRVENNKTGAGVRITSDRALSKFMYWSVSTTLSPEPFIQVDAEPGKQFSWAIRYLFYSTDTKTDK